MYTPCPLTVRAWATSRGPLLVVAGDLDLDVAPLLLDALDDAVDRDVDGRPVTVDLAGVDFCDSAGLHALLRARLRAEGRGIVLRLADPSPQMARLLEISGTRELFAADGQDRSFRA